MNSHSSRIVLAPAPGGPEVLAVETRALPDPDPGHVLIDVAASGVNRADVFERMGLYPPPAGASEGLGLEVSGRIRAVGEGVSGLEIGQSVVALVSGGGYADIVRACAGSTLPAPEGVNLVDAAGLPEAVFTVWTNVFDQARLQPGERFVVHGGAGGVGSAAIQMAKAHGAHVIATARGAVRTHLCRDLGADEAYDHQAEDWSARIREHGGADVILDMVGGDYVQQNLDCLNVKGRIVMIAFLRGHRVEVDLMGVMLKRQILTGSTLRSRSDAEKMMIAQAVHTRVWPWIAQGAVRPLIDSRFVLESVRQAHARMDDGGHAGKILLMP